MTTGLKIPKKGALDFLSLGALVHRLDPGIIPFRKATRCDIHVSGGEYNCAANLSDCFKLKTGIVSAMVDYPIGDLIAGQVRAMGVKPFYKHFPHDGARGPNMAAVYSDRGFGVRAPVVFYNRSNEAAAQLKPRDFNWKEIFRPGVRWFHSGGIFAALSPTTAGLIVEAMQAAQASGAITSFDLNYRAKLWNSSGDPDHAKKVLSRILRHVDVLFAGAEDMQLRLGLPALEIPSAPSLDPGAFYHMAGHLTQKHPQVQVVATTLREVHSASHHSWGAAAWVNGATFTSPQAELEIYDRVGGGDGFAAGFIYGLLTGESPQGSMNLGWAHGALLTTFPGDTTMATLEQVKAYAQGNSARIQR